MSGTDRATALLCENVPVFSFTIVLRLQVLFARGTERTNELWLCYAMCGTETASVLRSCYVKAGFGVETALMLKVHMNRLRCTLSLSLSLFVSVSLS
eukprot:676329-Rhodomonas_salina.2